MKKTIADMIKRADDSLVAYGIMVMFFILLFAGLISFGHLIGMFVGWLNS